MTIAFSVPCSGWQHGRDGAAARADSRVPARERAQPLSWSEVDKKEVAVAKQPVERWAEQYGLGRLIGPESGVARTVGRQDLAKVSGVEP